MSERIIDGEDVFYKHPEKEGQSVFHQLIRKHPNSMCMYPFTHLNMKPSGRLAPCFRSHSTGDLFEESMLNAWNNEAMLNLRKTMLSGELPEECLSCKKLEEAVSFSYRQESLRDVTIHKEWRPQLEKLNLETGEKPNEIKQVEVRFSNICNLKCRMCGPEYSSKWERDFRRSTPIAEWQRKNGHKYAGPLAQLDRRAKNDYKQGMLDFFKVNAKHLEYVMITGGEPLMDDSQFEALEILKPYGENMVLEYTTNLTTLGSDKYSALDYWPHFDSILLKVSFDGDPVIYPVVRSGASIEDVEKNIEKLFNRFPHAPNAKFKNFPGDKVVVIATFTSSVYNVGRIVEAAKYFTKLGGVFHSSQVRQPDFLNSQILPKEVKEQFTEKATAFVDNIEKEIEPYWGMPIWHQQDVKDMQMRRINRFIKNCIKFMNSEDKSDLFPKFLEFNALSEEECEHSIFDVYPEWKKYV